MNQMQVNILSGWWYTYPSEKIWKSNGMIFPNIWKNKKCSKPPTSTVYFTLETCGFWGSPISRAPPKSGPCRFQSDSPWVRHVQKRANVGNPGCHKPTMMWYGKHTTHKNGDDLGTVVWFIGFTTSHNIPSYSKHNKCYQSIDWV